MFCCRKNREQSQKNDQPNCCFMLHDPHEGADRTKTQATAVLIADQGTGAMFGKQL